VADIDLPTE